ncbi:MAG: Asp-tRNA(Asn)/Glu-tRNA(Gln) amidotransferase subunit GatB [Deltaproteobacteria bacterium]
MDFEVIIGFETHVELKTQSKLFCSCPVDYEASPNSRICPVCTGQPGALPVLNKKAVQFTVKAGIALGCMINRHSRFARKNYFYPDLPKGYQISQYEMPFCQDGLLEITGDDGRPYPVGIKRVHLEEDAGKLVHSSSSFESSSYSLVDYDRSSVPLLEIVTDHERNPLRSVQEGRTYLEKLRQILRYIEISDCSMEKGQFRCDVNISLRPKGAETYANRAEIKNMASFKSIMDALEYEIKRQSDLLKSDGEIAQQTRLFDEIKRITSPMRSKEDAPDYRYFPDPDLVEVELDEDFIGRIRKKMPELPDQKINRFVEEFEVPRDEVLILTKEKVVSDYFTTCAISCEDRKRLSRWIIKDLFKLLNRACLPMEQCPVQPEHFSTLVNLIAKGEVTERMARTILEEMFEKGVSPEAVIESKGLKPIQDTAALERIVDEVLAKNPEPVARIKAGNRKPLDFLIGQVMKNTRGKADPAALTKIIQKKLRS